jgi:hypothetical protein
MNIERRHSRHPEPPADNQLHVIAVVSNPVRYERGLRPMNTWIRCNKTKTVGLVQNLDDLDDSGPPWLGSNRHAERSTATWRHRRCMSARKTKCGDHAQTGLSYDSITSEMVRAVTHRAESADGREGTCRSSAIPP